MHLQIQQAQEITVGTAFLLPVGPAHQKLRILPLCQQTLGADIIAAGARRIKHRSLLSVFVRQPARDIFLLPQQCIVKAGAHIGSIQQHALLPRLQLPLMAAVGLRLTAVNAAKKIALHLQKITADSNALLPMLFRLIIRLLQRHIHFVNASLQQKCFRLRQLGRTGTVPAAQQIVRRHTILHILHRLPQTAARAQIQPQNTGRTEGPDALLA